MNAENDHSYFRCALRSESDAAYFVEPNGVRAALWVPKSLCALKPAGSGPEYILEVESWFAKKEGME